MSIELPEAKILAEQMNKRLLGKRIRSYHLQDYEKLQRIGMMNKDLDEFNLLIDREIQTVMFRGNVMLLKLNSGTSLILDPEYGGEILYFKETEIVPKKFHLKVDFSDGTTLTVRLTSMGVIQVMRENNLETSYVYRRDFNYRVMSPINQEFTLERFSKAIKESNRMLKSVLVGKDAIVVGLSNSAFQDVLFRAKLHPKRKSQELNENEVRVLYDSIRVMIEERIRLGGKSQFIDLYGKRGGYVPMMGQNMKEQACSVCGTAIQALNLGGGQVYYCPKCQL